jgi:hypothetical protein
MSGRQTGIQSIATAGGTITVTFEVHEPLILGPCVYAGTDDRHIFGVNRISLNCSFASAPWGMLAAIDAGLLASTAAVLAFSKHTLIYDEVMISDAAVLEVPRPWSYPYTQPQSFVSSAASALAAGGVVQGYSAPAIQVSTVPNRLLLAVVPKLAARAAGAGALLALANVCLPITQVSITVGGRPGLLGTATPHQLYEMSLAAGVQLPWQAWSGAQQLTTAGTGLEAAGVGGPLIVNFEDLSLPEGVYPGSNAQTQISATLSFTNHTSKTLDVDFIMIGLVDGLFTCLDGVTATTIGIPQKALEDAKVTHSPADLAAVARSHVDGGFSGGSSFSDAMSGIARGFAMPFRALGQVAPLAAAMAAPILGPGALPIGAALHGLLGSGAAVVGGGRKKKGGAVLHLA